MLPVTIFTIPNFCDHQVRAVDAGQQAAEQVPAEEPLHLPLPRLPPRQLSHVPAGTRKVRHSGYSVTIQFSAKVGLTYTSKFSWPVGR